MKCKITSIIISICLILNIFPVISFAEGWDGTTKTEPTKDENGTYVITNAQELAWFADDAKYGSSKNAVLKADIDLGDNEWTPIGKSNYDEYSGSFDGNGHTVSGLKVSNSAYAGFFGYVTGKVSNLTVTGELTYTSYSTSYAGGIAGYNKGTIENCVSDTLISGKPTCGGIAGVNEGTITGCINKGNISASSEDAGGIAGSAKGGIISLCINYGTVESTSYSYAGGIAGRAQGETAIENVYNTGDISGRYVGGIAGYVYSSSVSINNAYSAGSINCTGSYVGGIAGQTGYNVSADRITNCYFLKTDTVNNDLYAVQKASNDREDLCGKTEDVLKSADFISSLGGSFEADSTENPLNKGYPILKWQNPNASYKAVITVSPANSLVSLVNSKGEEINGSFEDGVYIFDNLSKGDYTYTVSQNEGDYKSENVSFTIANADYYKTVTLLPNTYTVSFSVTPDYAEFSLKLGDTLLAPSKLENGNYEYSLPNGSYKYSADAFGFETKTDSITVNKENLETSVMLERLPSAGITFSLTDKTSGLAIDNFRTEVKNGDYSVTAETDGSYVLPAGIYSYKVMCSGYAKCIGEFEVSQSDIDADSKIITLETEPSAAWDGDSDEPAYTDGVWQISTGNELAWFAEYINGMQTTEVSDASYNAVLTKDIDLGGEMNWTPIGPNSYKAYSGVFDGQGHTVSGLYINTTSACQGLFGKITLSAVIKNLTVEGNVKTTSASSYAYAGGICGYNYKGEITNCINKVNVTSDGGRTGGICGASEGDGSLSAKISQCANCGDISYEAGTGQYKGGITGESKYTNISECSNSGNIMGNGNFAGGIAGDLYSGSLVTDCYNSGNITVNGYSVGGVAGRMDMYGSYGIVNCYSVGEVQSTLDNPQNCGALIGLYSGGLNTNCYCLIDDNGINSGLSAIGKVSYGTPEEVTVQSSADEMRSILEDLNTNNVWTQNNKLNNGYPILLWQNTLAEYTATFTVNPNTADFKLLLNDIVIAPVRAENGVYEYSLKAGNYNYTASADGFYSETETVNIENTDIDKTITLEKIPDTNIYKIVIDVTPDEAQVILTDTDNNRITGNYENGIYTFEKLASGEYKYTVSYDAGDYIPQNGTITIDDRDISRTVELELRKHTVTFTLSPSDMDFVLRFGNNIIEPVTTENGVYEYNIANGIYTYTASKNGFYSSNDEITVNGEDTDIEITLTEIPEKTVTIDGEILKSDNAAVSAGQHCIDVDYSRIGTDIENGLLVLAVYNRNGGLEKVWLADETYVLSAEYDVPEGAVIKVLFWKNDLEPIINPVKIDTI